MSYCVIRILNYFSENFKNCHSEAQRRISQIIATTELEIPHFVKHNSRSCHSEAQRRISQIIATTELEIPHLNII